MRIVHITKNSDITPAAGNGLSQPYPALPLQKANTKPTQKGPEESGPRQIRMNNPLVSKRAAAHRQTSRLLR
ncbi:hypothetical protein VR7878_02687 [Vibrio ruber DSM 16370]|uniref:Uncharacterized protein n=1 Tax=Vibrio ruber (strain DSM 16370 / JCM 11486 / BCRC 17186 / CECT 7878 / LMG 23124 / VR1) TaxID=1123498 RepID=A0A1R4LNI1_VIBR1|nr:hypothetical protein VR7878_02687 [Vibrio ruber DSM 16370]